MGRTSPAFPTLDTLTTRRDLRALAAGLPSWPPHLRGGWTASTREQLARDTPEWVVTPSRSWPRPPRRTPHHPRCARVTCRTSGRPLRRTKFAVVLWCELCPRLAPSTFCHVPVSGFHRCWSSGVLARPSRLGWLPPQASSIRRGGADLQLSPAVSDGPMVKGRWRAGRGRGAQGDSGMVPLLEQLDGDAVGWWEAIDHPGLAVAVWCRRMSGAGGWRRRPVCNTPMGCRP